MITLTSKQRKVLLIVSSVFVLPFMILVFNTAALMLGTQRGFIIGFLFYWIYCMLFFTLIRNDRNGYTTSLIATSYKNKHSWFYILLAGIPILPVFIIQLLPHMNELNAALLILAIITAIANGMIEELYWRGLYLAEFNSNALVRIWLATFLFGGWHIALYTTPGMSYGGFWPLVGGAACMGLIWSFSAGRYGGILPAIISHSIVNVFAFSGLYIENGF